MPLLPGARKIFHLAGLMQKNCHTRLCGMPAEPPDNDNPTWSVE